MDGICPKCGLPKEICVCAVVEKEAVRKIKVRVEKAKFQKWITIIEGIEKNATENVAKQLKQKMACGGTVKNDQIILQGDHRAKIKDALMKIGYPEESISIV